MPTLNKDLGSITAYSFAVDGGFSGTAVQFGTGLATAATLGAGVSTVLSSKADLVDGKIPSTQLPSYVDDVVEGYLYNGGFYSDSTHETSVTGETGKIYVDMTNTSSPALYRWSGSAFIEVASKGVEFDDGIIFEAPTAGSITLSTNSVTINSLSSSTATVTISNTTGTVTVSSSNTSVATVSVSGNTITISSVNNTVGTATITVNVAASESYNGASTTISVTVIATNVSNADDTHVQISNVESFVDNYSSGQVCFQGDGNGKFYVKAGSYTNDSNPNITSTGTLIYDASTDMGEAIDNYEAAAHLANVMNYILYNTKGSSYGSNTALFTDTPTITGSPSKTTLDSSIISTGFYFALGNGNYFYCCARGYAGYYDIYGAYSYGDCAVWF